MRVVMLSMLMLMAGASVQAQLVTVGEPTYSGSGCPPGTADAIFVPDVSAISIAFSEMTTQALPRQKSRAACRVVIPLKVEKGVRAVIMDSDFEGFLSLPAKANADFSAIYRLFQGSRLKGVDVIHEPARGPFNGSYLVEETHHDRLVSPCGGTFSLDLDIAIGINNTSRTDAASFTIDSTNLAAYEGSMYFYVRTEKCK